MIISKDAEVILNSANFKHFHSLGYTDLKKGNRLIVPVEHLNKGSHSIIKVKCDVCGKEKDLMYRFYLKSLKSNGFYCCSSKCGQIKAEKTSLNRYGVKYYRNKEKFEQTCLNKYGYENPSQVVVFKDKRKETMLERHGVEYYVLNKDFKDKSEETSMKNYGVPHPQMSKEMKKVREEYYIKMGYNITSDEFDLYKNKVYYLTSKIKRELLKNWNGYDYYDDEYIKDNFDLPYHDINYPTIDHKTTIFEGFKNKIEAEDIANITNLCLTKRCINSRKYIKNDSDFII